MKASISLYTLFAITRAHDNLYAENLPQPVFIGDVYGPAPPFSGSMEPMASRAVKQHRKAARQNDFLRQQGVQAPQEDIVWEDTLTDSYYAGRSVTNCSFSMDIVILQDATASFTDNIKQVSTVELPQLLAQLSHADTRLGLVSHRDIPIWSLGDPTTRDYCVKLEHSLTAEFQNVIQAYRRVVSTAGADEQEAQYTALDWLVNSEEVGWRNTPDVTRLVILLTDAPPHFEGDNRNQYNLAPYPGHHEWSYGGPSDPAASPAEFVGGVIDPTTFAAPYHGCSKYYYPHPQHVKDSLLNAGIYLASLIYDPEYDGGLPFKSWEWFNGFINQTSDFVGVATGDDGDFTAKVLQIIDVIEKAECQHTCDVCGEDPNCNCPIAEMKIRHALKHVDIEIDYA